MNPDEDAMDEVRALLRTLDHPPPPVTAESLAVRARTADAARQRVRPLVRWAAAIALAAGATGAAYALPGSPLPRWIAAVAARVEPRSRPREAARPAALAGASAGIAVEPGDDLVIVFSPSAPGGAHALARVTLSERAEVAVRVPSGTATFTSDAGRLVVAGTGAPDTVAIEIPRLARRVEIRAGGARLFLKDGERIETRGARLGDGVYELPLARPPSQNLR